MLHPVRVFCPIRVWDIPYAYGHFPYPIRVWASRTRIGPRTRMGRYNCILRRLAISHCCLTGMLLKITPSFFMNKLGALTYDLSHPGDITKNNRSPLALRLVFCMASYNIELLIPHNSPCLTTIDKHNYFGILMDKQLTYVH